MRRFLASGRTASPWLASWLVVSGFALAACGTLSGASSDDDPDDESASPDTAEVADFYEGSTLTWVIARSAGGGFDQEARLIAPFLEEELGATIALENQGTAGGLVALNTLAGQTPGDGTVITNFAGQGTITAFVSGTEGVNFDLTEDFEWLGNLAGESLVVMTGPQNPELETFQDVIDADSVRISTTGPGAIAHSTGLLLGEVFGVVPELIAGFEGVGDQVLALQRGDTDIYVGSAGSRMTEIEAGDLRPLVVIAEERLEELPDVPTIFEFDMAEEDAELFRAHTNFSAVYRPVATPAGLPPERLDFLQEALANVLADPEFVEAAERAGRTIDPSTGDETKEMVAEILEAPERYRELLQEGGAE